MYLVLELNNDEFGRGNSRPVRKFDDEDALRNYLLSCNQDISRLEIYSARRVTASLKLETSYDD